MKKSLLLALFALVSTASTWAYEIGDYAYTQSQRMKIIGENLIQNGNFASGSSGWFNANGTDAPNAESWSVESGLGPNGEAVMMSISASAGDDVMLTNRWKLDGGYYVFSFDIFGSTYTNTSTTASGTQYVDLFTNTDGAFTKGDDATAVASATYYSEEWHKVNFVVFMEAGSYLVFNASRLSEGTQLTNFELHAAASVYDVRIVEKRLALISKLLEEPAFNTEEAQDVKAEILDIIGFINGEIANGGLDDESTAQAYMEEFEQKVSEFLDASSQNLTSNDFFRYVEDLTAFPKYNRGDISDGQQIGGFIFRGSNWLHPSGGSTLAKQIQGGYTNGPGSVALYNTNLPAGKYYVSGSMRNAYCDKNYNYTWNLENQVKAFVGNDSVDCGTIVGEDYVTFYAIGEIKEGQPLEAGFWWNDQATQGTRFEVKDFEIRSFGDVLTPYLHNKAWSAFIAQWNAAVSAREGVLAKIGDKNYPWEQDSLKAALAQWDPYYNEIIAKGWITADGTDAGIATTDELNDWAIYQGVELYSEPDEEGNITRLQYQVVRGYQNATSYVLNTNKPFTDLAEAIDAAKETRNNGTYSTGDRETYKAAILKAISTITSVRQNTSDATREADAETLAAALEELNAATEAFIASAALTPFLTIDFSNDFEQLETEEGVLYWAIKGQGGQMEFPDGSVDTSHGNGETGSGTAGYNWTLGHGEELLDMLRIGSTTGTVNVPVEVGDDEAIRIQLDLWIGYLNKCNTWIELKNANGDVVASLMRNNSNGTSETTFGLTADQINKYMTTRGNSSTSNVAIVVDANKTSVDMTIDYKNKTQKLTLVNGNAGILDAPAVALNTAEVETTNEEGETITVPFDNKVTQLVVRSNYSSQKNNDRRSWMDNVQMSKFKVTDIVDDIPESPWADAIETVIVAPAAKVQGIYNLQGVKMNSENLPAGLYIINGKKVVIQ